MKIKTQLLFAFASIILLVILNGVLVGNVVSTNLRDDMIARAKTDVAANVQLQAKLNLNKEIFDEPDLRATQTVFRQFFSEIGTEDILRIKVWDREAKIIYSDQTDIIGKTFPNNEEFSSAIRGNIEAAIKVPIKPENILETGYGQLMEVYVPISFDGSNEVNGVIETAAKLDSLNAQITATQQKMWYQVATGITIASFVSILMAFHISRSISRPITLLKNAAHEIAKGNFVEPLRAKNKDWSELGELSNSFDKMAEDLKKINEMRSSRFISAVTHELRTPLVSIKGFNDLILSGRTGHVPAKIQEKLKLAQRNIDRLSKLTDDLLDLERMESGKLTLRLERTNLVELLDRCISEMKPLTDAKHQHIHLEVANNFLYTIYVMADSIRLSQCFVNLLSNANKFTPESGRITIRVEEDLKNLKVKVTDSGIGIHEKDLARVFEPFSNIEKKEYVKGTGLGLSVTKGLIEAHGGRIWIASAGEEKGTTLTFTLPIDVGEKLNGT